VLPLKRSPPVAELYSSCVTMRVGEVCWCGSLSHLPWCYGERGSSVGGRGPLGGVHCGGSSLSVHCVSVLHWLVVCWIQRLSFWFSRFARLLSCVLRLEMREAWT
jgi:hypothetical protein